MTKRRKGKKIVELHWVDAHRKDGWRSDKEIEEWNEGDGYVRQVGFLLKEDKKWIIIAGGLGEDKTNLCVHRIPKGMIIKRRNLRDLI